MKSFVHEALPGRVLFGAGSLAHLGAELERLGLERALILSTPGQAVIAMALSRQIGARCVGVYPSAVMHVPMDVVLEARREARRVEADCAVAIGGGSTTGLGKAIALESGLPLIAIPTTYAGSEMTPIYGITEHRIKRTGRDPSVLPQVVIYDPELSRDLPYRVSITSGVNAIAHAAEGLYARDGNPVMCLIAEEGIHAIASSLPRLIVDPRDQAARSEALYGAWLCGSVLGSVGMALHHKLCHTLGGSFDLPHAEVHTVVLPHALKFNARAAPEAMRRIQRALGAEAGMTAAMAIHDLARRCGAPTALRDIGMKYDDLDLAAELAVANPYWNPRQLGRDEQPALRQLLQDAWEGAPPS